MAEKDFSISKVFKTIKFLVHVLRFSLVKYCQRNRVLFLIIVNSSMVTLIANESLGDVIIIILHSDILGIFKFLLYNKLVTNLKQFYLTR